MVREGRCAIGGRESKPFFFEKKKQKTFTFLGFALPRTDRPTIGQLKFFASFFKKEALAFLHIVIALTNTPARFQSTYRTFRTRP
jgi:hypothetical protein